MIKKLFIVVLAIFMTASLAGAIEVGGKQVPDTLKAGNENLLLNGAGIRKKFGMKIYACGLYLKQKNNNGNKVLMADEPMAIRLHIISSLVSPKKMSKSTRKGFKGSMAALSSSIKTNIQPQIEQFIALFQDGISVDDKYDLIYLPGVGVQAYKNGKLKTTVKGLDFKKALFGIWISDKPIKKGLKNEMLGK